MGGAGRRLKQASARAPPPCTTLADPEGEEAAEFGAGSDTAYIYDNDSFNVDSAVTTGCQLAHDLHTENSRFSESRCPG